MTDAPIRRNRKASDRRYRISAKGRATRSAYKKSPVGKAAKARQMAKYLKSDKGAAATERYVNSAKGIDTGKRCIDRYRQSGKCKAYMRKYFKSEKGKAKLAEYQASEVYKRSCFARQLAKFGLTIQEYEQLALTQGGVCAICGKPDEKGRRLAVDHDHQTGKVRGLLCRKHNMALGLLGDTLEDVAKAHRYLVSKS